MKKISKSLVGAWVCLALLVTAVGGWIVITEVPPEYYFESKIFMFDIPKESQAIEYQGSMEDTRSENSVAANSLPQQQEEIYDFLNPKEITEKTDQGLLPKISDTGKTAIDAHKSKISINSEKPSIVFIISGLGMNQEAMKIAIEQLPPEISLSFLPFTKDLKNWVKQAREKGHEVLLDLAMEPNRYPIDDPGAKTLLTGLKSEKNISRLHWVMKSVGGYVGLINHMGSRFLTSSEDLVPVLTEINNRGLLFIEHNVTFRSIAKEQAEAIGLPFLKINTVLSFEDSNPMDQQLLHLLKRAQNKGKSFAIIPGDIGVIKFLKKWLSLKKNKNAQLIPVTHFILEKENAK